MNEAVDRLAKDAKDIDLCKVSIALAFIATVALRNWVYVVYAFQGFMLLMIASKLARRWTLPDVRPYLFSYGFLLSGAPYPLSGQDLLVRRQKLWSV